MWDGRMALRGAMAAKALNLLGNCSAKSWLSPLGQHALISLRWGISSPPRFRQAHGAA